MSLFDQFTVNILALSDCIDITQEMWQSVFYQSDRLFTSSSFCNRLRNADGIGIRGDFVNSKHSPSVQSPSAMIPLPFSMMLYAATSMPHVDDTRNVLDLSFRNSIYERAVFGGDTLSRHFVIEGIRESSNGRNVLIDVKCKMYNQVC